MTVDEGLMDPAFLTSELSSAAVTTLLQAKKIDLQELVTKGLWDGRVHVRQNSALALALTETPTAEGLELIPIAAKDGDPTVRNHCFRLLGTLDLDAELAVTSLLGGLCDLTDENSEIALTSLEKITGRTGVAPLLVEALADPRPIVQVHIVELLMRQATRCVDALIGGLLHPHLSVKRNSQEILRMLGGAVAAQLIKALDNEGLKRPVAAILADVKDLQPREEKQVEAMAENEDPILARMAQQILRSLATLQAAAAKTDMGVNIPGFTEQTLDADSLKKAEKGTDTLALFLSCRDGRHVVRRNAAALLALVATGEESRAHALRVLAPLAKDPHVDVRRTVVATVATLGGAESIEVLLLAIGDTVPAIATIARQALDTAALIHPKEVLGKLHPRQSARTHRAAVGALAKSGKKGARAIAEALQQATHPLRRQLAAQTLGKMGSIAAAESGTLLSALKDPFDDVRQHAARALGKLGVTSESVLDGLHAGVNDSVASVRGEASWALDRLHGKPEVLKVIESQALPAPGFESDALSRDDLAKSKKLDAFHLRLLLSDGRNMVRINAATALSTLGKDAADAIVHLSLGLQDTDRDVRLAAAKALGILKLNAPVAVPALANALVGANEELERALMGAVKAFGKAALAPALSLLAARPEKLMKTLLPLSQAQPKLFTPGLAEALEAPRTLTQRENAADVLAELGVGASGAEKDLLKALKGDLMLLRIKIIRALGRVAPPSKTVNEALEEIKASDARPAVLDAIDDARRYLRSRARG